MTRRSDSGSSRSPSGVESTMSEKTTVTVFRTSCAEGACASGAAQAWQNRAPPGFACPQFGHAAISPESRTAASLVEEGSVAPWSRRAERRLLALDRERDVHGGPVLGDPIV